MNAFVTAVTAAVDFSAITTGIGTVMAAVAGVLVVMKGGSMLLSAIKR